jgi:5-formyltetrahydrofolate cyclo-ligase
MTSTTSHLPDVSGLGVLDAKGAIRAHVRSQRRARSPRERARLAEEIAAVALEPIDGAACVAAYVARPDEPGTAPLLAALHRTGVKVLLPVLGPGLSRSWGLYKGPADLSVRAPGRPPEPSGPAEGPEALAAADAVVIPALAVDARGTRLGQGGGWYDRALRHARPGALLLALLYDGEQLDAELPRDPHDVPVNAVATPSGWRRLG